jgi:hypothetical protein
MGRGRGRLQRGLALGHLLLFHLLHVGAVVHVDLRLGGVLLFLLRPLGGGFGVVFLAVILAGRIGVVFLIVLGAFVLALVVQLVGVVAQLVAIAQIVDHRRAKRAKADWSFITSSRSSSVPPARSSMKPRHSSMTLAASGGRSRPVARWRMR